MNPTTRSVPGAFGKQDGMDCRMKNRVVNVALMSCLFTAMGWAQVTSGQKVETEGLILTRDGDSLTVDTRDLGKVVVSITDSTKVQAPTGLFRHKDMEMTSLVPGLEVRVKGVGTDNGQVQADRIRFDEDSLKRAQQMHAAMTATNAQVATNQQGVAQNQAGVASNAAGIDQHSAQIQAAQKRFDDLTEWDTKKDITLNFETGKSDLSDDHKQQLSAIAKDAKGMKGYLIEVMGFASTTGNAQQNQQLSQDRAENVEDFLHQQGVPLKNLVNTAAMGTTSPVASNDTQMGQLQNQRVEVKLLLNRGLAGK